MSRQTDSDLPILIAGGGIGGLATALALAEVGRSSQIFEKRASFENDGAGIQIGPNGVKALRTLGVARILEPLAAQPIALQIFDGLTGQRLAEVPLGSTIEARHGAPYWTLRRSDLHAALLGTTHTNPHITLQMSAAAVQASNVGVQSVSLVLDDGDALSGSSLIAADGLWSRLRTGFGSAPVYSGKRAFRTIIPTPLDSMDPIRRYTRIWLRPGLHAVHYPVSAGAEIAIVLIVSHSEPGTGWSNAVDRKRLIPFIETLPDPLKATLLRAENWRSWPLMHAAPLTKWTDGRIALLGDAAHPILPFLAQGAVLALEDAIVLARCVGCHSDFAAAFKAYELRRQPRARRVAQASERNGRIYQLPKPLAAIRNAVLRRQTPDRLLQRFDWIYGWSDDAL